MSLVEEYRQQQAFRSWPRILDALPEVAGRTVLDLGCGAGDLAAELVRRGARVVGVDANEELLAHARARGLASAGFHLGDLRQELPVMGADGIWCSFAAAYLPDLPAVLRRWRAHLRPGGFLALTEVDDLFGHRPLAEHAQAALADYARAALRAGRYDFRMGRRLAEHAAAAGFTVLRSFAVDDLEFAFRGPARPDVLAAWRRRLDRMRLLQEACGAGFAAVRDAFLQCLQDEGHEADCSVQVCIATAPVGE